MDADRATFAIAALLAALAGYVDAMGFITLGGFFVSFMSGNTTQAGVALVDGQWHPVLVGASVVALFVLGVTAGSVLGHLAGRRRRPAVMALVAVLISVATVCSAFGPDQAVIAALTLAMGIENTVFDGSSASSISLTYVTGTLVKVGRGIAAALTGGPRWDWLRFAGLWLALSAGVLAGAATHRALGLAGLWFAVAVALVLAGVFARTRN
ncbi:YoaK family protein [Rhodococcus sp. NPDC003318]|uniref:YoaK family protein n=1 Tax=Rhodococcus sp. NPDC003318 TaxID=3364503 RepID=UPI00369AD0CB